MTDLPTIAIVMVTYKRTREALLTVNSVCENLEYPRERRGWYIADDGSPKEHMDAIFHSLLDVHRETLWGNHNEKFLPGTYFCGRGWNMALRAAHQYSDIVMWIEDDWELRRRLDIAPYVRLLLERDDVGLVRMGHLAVGSEVLIVGHNGIHYLKYMRTTPYAYSGNPLLRHKRMTDFYGWFHEAKTPGEIELDYDSRYCAQVGPDIWRPADIPGWGIFGHIGTDKTWS